MIAIAELMPISSISPEDAQTFADWAWARREQTCFDADTLSYIRSCIAKVSDAAGPIMFLPFHPVLMFESLISKPGIGAGKTALGLHRIGQEAERIAHHTGHGEAYFITNDAAEVALVVKRGWTIALHDGEKGLWLIKRKFPQKRDEGQ